ncbi:transmembrane protein 201 isoform X2 [Amia ocellicauda]|uniref:transmembrane protein 201 isoform X2 n=1 Tax=Amia ocellicauda TaxID=2972642 RepID=UPI0034644B9C
MDVFNQILAEYPQLTLAGGVGATVCTAGAVIYRIATRKKPTHVNVNCWFCNQDTIVPYGNRNCWDCPNCEQYNGFQENGDYNKPIPAQYMEHLNHGVSAGLPVPDTSKTLHWVNCQMLLCKKCNNNQTLKIKQLASFAPREEEKYDEEIEVYKHHLEQTYKLCRPCQTAVEYYIKYQNRQLRALLFNHQLRRSRDADKAFIQNSYTFSTPAWVIFLRILAFLTCSFLVALMIYGSGGPFIHDSPSQPAANASEYPPGNGSSSESIRVWPELLSHLPEEAVENARAVWDFGRHHQMAVVALGLFMCLLAVLMGGRLRLRRIDAVASILWFLVMALHLVENYLKTDVPSWLDTVKLSTTSLCCVVGFTAAMATRKSTGQRRTRARRYLSGGSLTSFYNGDTTLLSSALSGHSVFIPMPPPNLSHLISHQLSHRVRKASPSSLPGRLNRALSLGTIPSLTRTDSGYLFSGSRPSSQGKDSPPSDYYSLKSGSRPSSPGPSPTPSVAGSVTSTSSSARHRRPLISPARLKLTGQKLQLFSPHAEPPLSPVGLVESSPSPSSVFTPEGSAFPPHHQDMRSLLEGAGLCGDVDKKRGSSSGSSACLVDTTTGVGSEGGALWKGLLGPLMWRGVLCTSLTLNFILTVAYLYHTWT